MDLYIERDELGSGLARIQSIAEKKGATALVDHVLLQAVDTGLRLTATDTEIASVGLLQANVRAAGAIAVGAAQLFQIVRSLPEPSVHLKIGAGNRLEIGCGRSKFKLPGRLAEDFPTLPSFEARSSTRITEGTLRRLVEQVSFAVAVDDVRFGLNGAHLESEPGLLRMVATDGHRLSSVAGPIEGGALDLPKRMLVPRKALAVLRKLLDGEGSSVALEFGDGSVRVSREHESFWFRLIDGEFPDYRAIVPVEHSRTITVRREDLVAALKRAAILSTDKSRSARFSFESTELEVEVTNLDRGEVTETVPVALDGEAIRIGLNARYLGELLGVIAGDEVVLEMNHELAPVVVRDPKDESAFFIVMPMRVE